MASRSVAGSMLPLEIALFEVNLAGVMVSIVGLSNGRCTRSRGLSEMSSDPEVVLPRIRLDCGGFQFADPILAPSDIFSTSSCFCSPNDVFSHSYKYLSRDIMEPEENSFLESSVEWPRSVARIFQGPVEDRFPEFDQSPPVPSPFQAFVRGPTIVSKEVSAEKDSSILDHPGDDGGVIRDCRSHVGFKSQLHRADLR